MASPSQALVLRFSTDLEGARRNLTTFAAQASTQLASLGASSILAARNMGLISDQAGGVGSSLQKVAGYLVTYKAAVLATTAVLAGVGIAAAEAHVQMEKLTQIADGSKAADVSSTFFQNWIKQAEQAGIAAKDAEAAIIAARTAVGDKRDGLGNVAPNTVGQLLQENATTRGVNVQAADDFFNTKDTEKRIRIVIDAVRELHDEAQKTFTGALDEVGNKLLEVTFGTDKFGDAIRNAKDGAEALTAVGLDIIPPEQVARLGEMNDKLREAHQQMANDLQPVANDLLRVSLDIKGAWSDVVGMLERAVAAAGRFYSKVKEMGTPTLAQTTGAEIARQFPAGGSALIEALGGGASLGRQVGAQIAPAFTPPAPAPTGVIGVPSDVPTPFARPDQATLDKKQPKAAASANDQVDTYTEQLRKQVEVLLAEADAYGKSNREKTIAVDLAKAESAARQRGTPLTENETAAVKKLAEQEATLKQRILEQKQATEQAHEQAQFLGQTLADAFDKLLEPGARASDIIDGITKSLMKAAVQAVLLGQGPLAGLFGMGAPAGATGSGAVGGVFGQIFSALPKFADGGAVPGVNGAVPIMAHAGEIVLNRAQQASLAAGMQGGGGTSVVINNHAGADVSAQETQGPGGMRQIEIFVDQALARAAQKNTRGAQAWQRQFGLNRATGL